MFDRYRRILSVPGALRFSGSALVARLPMAMVTIGIVLLVTGAGRSYGLAGAMSAVYLIAAAALAIPQARLVDRLGQAPVLTTAAAVFAVGLTVFVVVVQTGGPDWVAFVSVTVAGGAFPQVGSCVRTRWSHVLDERAEIDTAYALESAVDEVVFMTGPIIVTVLATGVAPRRRARHGDRRRHRRDPLPRHPALHLAAADAARPGHPARCDPGRRDGCRCASSGSRSAPSSVPPRWPPSRSRPSTATRGTPACCWRSGRPAA